MNLADVLDEIGEALDLIDGLRVYPYMADAIQPPAAIVAYPDSITFDQTYDRGIDRMAASVIIAAGRASARAARDVIAEFADGSGRRSVKATIEGRDYTTFDSVRVLSAEFDVITVANVDYIAATFELDVVGSGT